jgi:hypothetical protein
MNPSTEPAVVAAADPLESFLDREYSAGLVTHNDSVTKPKGG